VAGRSTRLLDINMNRQWLAAAFWCISMAVAATPAPGADCVTIAKPLLQKKFDNTFSAGSVISGPVTIEQAEAEGMRGIQDCSQCPKKPFGYANKEWVAFVRDLKSGDCIVFFRNSTDAWSQLFGVEGYAIVRAGKLRGVFLTSMS
jgi:hypothetical protein